MAVFSDQLIWITGASQGIGRALALALAGQGAIPVLTARSRNDLDTVQREIESNGGRAAVHPGDVTDGERMQEIVREVEGELGPIDMLIANAGAHLFTRPEAFDTAEYLDLMNLNYGGTLHCIEAVLPGMLERRRGRIVGVASLAGFRALPRAAAYGASKAALINFFDSIRFHLERHGVGVTVVNPGFVRTPLTDKNDFTMPFLMEPDDAAHVICRGLSRDKKEIAFPFPFSTTIRLLRVLPYPIYERIMRRVWARMEVQ
ncbi:MAG: SDR family NAD(P)-dependent oxidoreductase [Planctomycetota bacterium]